MTSLHLFLLILLMCAAHFLDIFTSIIPYGTFKGTLKRRMLTYGQKTSQDVSYMTTWDETVLV